MWKWKSVNLVTGSAIIVGCVSLAGCGKGLISGEYRADCIGNLPQYYGAQTGTGTGTPTAGGTYYGGAGYIQALSMKAALDFSGDDDVKAKIQTYSSNDCTGNVHSEIEIESKYKLGTYPSPTASPYPSQYPTQYQLGTQTIDFTAKKVQVKRKSHEQVASSNLYRECGIVNWEVNKRRDVSKTDCADDWSIAQTPFNVISIMGDRIYLGDASYGGGGVYGGGGKTAEQRVNVLGTVPYIKKR